MRALDEPSARRVVEYFIKRKLSPEEIEQVTAVLQRFDRLPLAIVHLRLCSLPN